MQSKGLLALIGVTAVVTVAAIAVSLGGSRNAAEAGSGEAVLTNFSNKIGDAAALKTSGAGGTLTLQRKAAGSGWGIAEKGGYPADPGKIRQTLLGFAELKLVEPKTRKAELYDRLDVEDPGKAGGHARLVEIDDASGAKLGELIVGKRRPDRLGTGADGLYIRRPGDAQAWLAQG